MENANQTQTAASRRNTKEASMKHPQLVNLATRLQLTPSSAVYLPAAVAKTAEVVGVSVECIISNVLLYGRQDIGDFISDTCRAAAAK